MSAPASLAQSLVPEFDNEMAGTRRALERVPDAHLRGTWLLKWGGRTMSTKTRRMVMRGWVLSHLIHHRAQLGVYLRLLDVPVPMQYGPTADEGDVMG